MLEDVQFGWEIFTLIRVAYITVDFTELANDPFRWFRFGRKRMYQEKDKVYRIVQT